MNIAVNTAGSEQQVKAIEIQAMKKTHHVESNEPTSEISTDDSNYKQMPLRYSHRTGHPTWETTNK
jgi:hypothetical protein